MSGRRGADTGHTCEHSPMGRTQWTEFDDQDALKSTNTLWVDYNSFTVNTIPNPLQRGRSIADNRTC